jgi:hypothetical protein
MIEQGEAEATETIRKGISGTNAWKSVHAEMASRIK